MLVQRISSVNSLSALCGKTGTSIEEVSKAIGMDHCIGNKFLNVSVGFGGSCFQKEILNLVYLCQTYGLYEVAEYWLQVIKINDYQKNYFAQKLIEFLPDKIATSSIALMGWTFKKTPTTVENQQLFTSLHIIWKKEFKLRFTILC